MSNNDIKYFCYVRKSSEGKEKQALSIPAQKDKAVEMFGDLDIEFVEEQKSAFTPFNRPAFANMLERIRNGERQGLLAWSPDRLSRNEVDAGAITYMIRKGELKDLKFATYTFENTPEGIWMLQMALSQSQYESAKKGRDVKRGLEQRVKMGIYPALAPLGYQNDKYAERGSKTILPDEERFDAVRKMFDLMLTGEYSVMQILRIANEKWGFKNPHGKPLSRATLYFIFMNPFYYGEFEYPKDSGKWHQGIHKPMITREEYDRVGQLMGRPDRPRPKKRKFAYRGPIHCGNCGAMITAEAKVKRQKNGNVHFYTYYHCTKRKDPSCTEGSIEEKKLEEQIAAALDTVEVPQDFVDWGLKRLSEMQGQEAQDRDRIYGTQRRDYESCIRKIDNLIDMRANQELTEEEFRNRKEALLKEKARHKELLDDTDQRVDNWLETVDRGFNFAHGARVAFEEGSPEEKKGVFVQMGSNLWLKGGEVSIDWDNLLVPLQDAHKEDLAIRERLEPLKSKVNKRDFGALYDQSPVMLRGSDSNRQPIR